MTKDNLQELSNKTLKSYIKKAASDSKHSGSEAQYVFSKSKEPSDYYDNKGKKLYNKSNKRLFGVRKAVDKLSESLLNPDQYFQLAEMVIGSTINELSKNKLSQYANKAYDDIRQSEKDIKIFKDAGGKTPWIYGKDIRNNEKIIDKRTKGKDLANQKISNIDNKK